MIAWIYIIIIVIFIVFRIQYGIKYLTFNYFSKYSNSNIIFD